MIFFSSRNLPLCTYYYIWGGGEQFPELFVSLTVDSDVFLAPTTCSVSSNLKVREAERLGERKRRQPSWQFKLVLGSSHIFIVEDNLPFHLPQLPLILCRKALNWIIEILSLFCNGAMSWDKEWIAGGAMMVCALISGSLWNEVCYRSCYIAGCAWFCRGCGAGLFFFFSSASYADSSETK